ncbi:hypothetical protein TNCV_3881581 [Trichonephila clavipes]|nr:hypothetical protein TNCV_3881551 [Trichonephila clavipes]GFW38791.1 hypothetical protein TNCV_3881581 [Trichonephila clavipes]
MGYLGMKENRHMVEQLWIRLNPPNVSRGSSKIMWASFQWFEMKVGGLDTLVTTRGGIREDTKKSIPGSGATTFSIKSWTLTKTERENVQDGRQFVALHHQSHARIGGKTRRRQFGIQNESRAFAS